MLWFSLALLTAIFSATEAAWLKKRFSDLGFLEMAAFPFPYALPLLGLGCLLLPRPALGLEFWLWLALLLPLNGAGFLLQIRAIHLSPLSLTMPFLAFTPVFVILTGWLLLGEQLNLPGIAGVAAITAGGFVLGRERADDPILAPLRRLVRERGPLYMLGAALVFSLTSVIGKKLILLSSPLFFACLFFFCFGCLLLTGLTAMKRIRLRKLLSRPRDGVVAALLLCGHIACHQLALSMTKTAYMMAIKRLNGLFSVGLGWIWFKETGIRFRLTGAALMTAGAAIIALWG
ncbi:MAG: EamA family transporter [Desulfovibrio sp.]